MKYISPLLLFAFLLTSGCGSVPVKSSEIEVEVSREKPDDSCSFIDDIRGLAARTGEGEAEALQDLQKEAARRGANYVQVLQFSSLGTAVNGKAYLCQ